MNLKRALPWIALVAFAGCRIEPKKIAEDRTLDIFLARAVQDTAIQNAIIAQHTLFPYHFIPDSGDLNELGLADLAVLAGHYREHPGTLSIRKGEVGKDLYEARVKGVRERLEKAGVQAGSVAISDAVPGGPGMPSERVTKILQREEENRSREPRTSTYTMGSGMGSAPTSSRSGTQTRTGGTR